MQIYDIIDLHLFEHANGGPHISIKQMNAIDIWICRNKGSKVRFGEVMDLCIFDLLFQVTYNGRSKNNVPDRTEPDNQEFYHLHEVLKEDKQSYPVLCILGISC